MTPDTPLTPENIKASIHITRQSIFFGQATIDFEIGGLSFFDFECPGSFKRVTFDGPDLNWVANWLFSAIARGEYAAEDLYDDAS